VTVEAPPCRSDGRRPLLPYLLPTHADSMTPSPPSHLSSTPRPAAWHAQDVESALASLSSSAQHGLTQPVVQARLVEYGANVLQRFARTPWYAVFARQFANAFIAILFVAAGISLAVGEVVDAVAVLTIIVLNTILGFIQEWRAERAVEALRRLLAPQCTVVRGGRPERIDAQQLVPGDIVIVEAGDRIPADVRWVRTLDIRTDESALTGESVPIDKSTAPSPPDAPLADRASMGWMGTVVAAGRARAVVVATGMRTEFGRIARLAQSVDRAPTPLQRRLATLARQLGIASIVVASATAGLGLLLGQPLLDMFLTSVSLAVAVVPEGLPAVVTVTLALGVRAMAKRRALIRRLPAAETLGAVTALCTDKTGTLTQNEMTVRNIWLPAGDIEVTGVGYAPAGAFLADGRAVVLADRPDLEALLGSGAFCNHARLEVIDGTWRALGDPTEIALLTAACKAGLDAGAPPVPVAEIGFTSQRKRMTAVERDSHGRIAHTKGAPEVLLPRCTRLFDGARERDVTASDRDRVTAAYTALAERGLRTLAVARRSLGLDADVTDDIETDMTLLGVIGIIDPPRPEVAPAVARARAAGIRTYLITGDAGPTALAVARRIGLDADHAILGPEIDATEDDRLRDILRRPVIFARTTPEHKLRIVRLLQERGEIVGMTGDGVNDAPALKQADIGIAMGIRGTDVARDASDMVVTDDNYASIVGAIEEGRRQFDNIQKFVRYLLSSNTGEIVAILGNILLGGPLILLPVQILWMNLVTDGLTALALGTEGAEPGIMDRPPRNPRQGVLTRQAALVIAGLGSYIGLATIWLFHNAMGDGQAALAHAQTVAFTGIIVLEKVNVLNFRSFRTPLVRIGWRRNLWLPAALVLSIGLQLLAVYLPVLQTALRTVPLRLSDWALMIGLGLPLLAVPEAVKWRLSRRMHPLGATIPTPTLNSR